MGKKDKTTEERNCEERDRRADARKKSGEEETKCVAEGWREGEGNKGR